MMRNLKCQKIQPIDQIIYLATTLAKVNRIWKSKNYPLTLYFKVLLNTMQITPKPPGRKKSFFRSYLSLILLFIPAVLFGILLFLYGHHLKVKVSSHFPYLNWQFYAIAVFGTIATIGGVLDWKYHRNPLNMKIPKKERDAEALALGAGGIPMFLLMWFAMLSPNPANFLIPILVVLIYTVVGISYDEFVFHIKRCGKLENRYHRMLVFGNGLAWMCWFHFIYCA